MRKQSIGKRVPCYWDDKDDIAVAEILVQLLDLIPVHDYSKPAFAWGAKRRRSSISQPPTSSVAIETKSSVVVAAAAAASPATPLMFSPSESDIDKDTETHVSLSKRKNKDELMQSFTDLTHQKDSLVKEMEGVKRHLDVLRASNLELNRRKQVIIYGYAPPSLQALQQQELQLHYPFQPQQIPSIQWSSSVQSVPAVNKMGPMGLPDLNLTLEEVAAAASAGSVEGGGSSDAMMMVMDYNVNNRALASAQARKRRMQIYKEKNKNQILRQRIRTFSFDTSKRDL